MQQHRTQWEINNGYFTDHPKNLKVADLKPTAKCVYEWYFSVFKFSKKNKAMQAGKYIVGRA